MIVAHDPVRTIEFHDNGKLFAREKQPVGADLQRHRKPIDIAAIHDNEGTSPTQPSQTKQFVRRALRPIRVRTAASTKASSKTNSFIVKTFRHRTGNVHVATTSN